MGLLAASLVLAGCGRKDDTNADVPPADSQESSERSDMGGTVSQQAEEVRQDVVEGAQAMADGAREVAGDVKQAASEAVQTATDEMSDASITASVNAELAKDESLSALKINVDTQGGQVMLRGTAPTTTARERATTLAMAVKGVKKVDNQLTLQAAKP